MVSRVLDFVVRFTYMGLLALLTMHIVTLLGGPL
jgi:hypothetical protein